MKTSKIENHLQFYMRIPLKMNQTKTPTTPIKTTSTPIKTPNTPTKTPSTPTKNTDLRCFVARQFLSRIYALFWCTIFKGLKMRWCTKKDKYKVWCSHNLIAPRIVKQRDFQRKRES